MELQDKISLTEKVNISHNRLDEKIMNKSEKNIIKNDINTNINKNILLSKKSTSPQGRIRAYKNKYSSPEINRIKQANNKMILDIKHFKNKENNKEEIMVEQPNYLQNSINVLNSQNISTKILLKDKIFDDDKNMNKIEENNMNYLNNMNNQQNFENLKKDLLINKDKVLQKSKSSNEFYIRNKELFDGFDKYQKISKKANFEFINFQFPREEIIKNNSIEIIPGKFEVLNHNNKDLFMNNLDKQIINQENIIINNGFVNMNNNYYVNNNNINNNDNKKMSSQEFMRQNLNGVESNNDINYKNNIMYNNDNNFFNSKLIDLNYMNKNSNHLININYNNDSNKEYNENKFIQKEFDINYNQDFNPLYKSENYFRDNYINESKQSNFNLEENNFESNYISHSPPHSLRINYPKMPEFDNKRIKMNIPYLNNNKRINNNYSRNDNILKPMQNPSYFHPNFHPNIPFQYISILKIQYPIQMMVKKSPKIQLVRNKIIKYFPPKVQIEIRPCLIFIPLFKKIRKNKNKKIPNDKNKIHHKVKHKRPVFKIPPFKKASLSQGKSLNFIHKYYDENFILEEEDGDEEEINNNKDISHTERKTDEVNNINSFENNNNANKISNNNNTENNEINKEQITKKIILNINNKENNNIEEKKKNVILNTVNKEENKSVNQSISNKINKTEANKIYLKEKQINRIKIPIRNDNLQRKNKTDRILLINIKKKKRSPIKEMMNTKKNIQNIFSLNEVKQKFNSLNNSLRVNSTSVSSIEKSRETTLNINYKSKIVNKKENIKSKNIKIINFYPKQKILQKSNSFRNKKAVDKMFINKYNSNLNNSYKNLTIKKLGEKNNSYKNIYKNRVVKIDLSKL